MAVIQIPPKTKAKLTELLTEQERISGQINGIVETLRETMNVPDSWTLTNLERGFVPPPGEIAETGDVNHE